MTGIIYCYTNKVNGKKYVGQTTWTPAARAGLDGNRYDRRYKFGKAIEKYSLDAFDFEELEILEATDKRALRLLLNERERYYVSLFDSYVNGYNSDRGGNSHEHTDETKQKIRKTKLANQQKPGYKHPNQGKHLSEETKAKLSTARLGQEPWNKGMHVGANCRRVLCVETKIVYDSIAGAARALDIYPQSIGQVLRGRSKTAGGYHWEYVKEA